MSKKELEMHPFVAAIVHHLQGKPVEVYSGDTGTVLKYGQYDATQKSVVRGIVKAGWGDCLIIEVGDTDVYLNPWCISSVIPMNDPEYMKDVYKDADFDIRADKRRHIK